MEQLFGSSIENKIYAADVNAEMIGLRQEHTVRRAARHGLMRVTGDKHGSFRKFRGQRHDIVREIIATGARLQSHVASQHNRIRTFTLCFRDCPAYELVRISKIKTTNELRSEPKRHSGRSHSNDRDFNSRDF